MRKDWSHWTIYVNASHFHNWGIGIDYYHEYAFGPTVLLAKIFQINFLFGNITVTRWQNKGWDL